MPTLTRGTAVSYVVNNEDRVDSQQFTGITKDEVKLNIAVTIVKITYNIMTALSNIDPKVWGGPILIHKKL